MDTLADRLTKALNELAPLDVRGDKKALTGAMSERMESADKRPGTSYPSVLGYFAGRTQPSLDWIAVAGLVMGVRREWLAFGRGLATEAEEGLRAALSPRPEEAGRLSAALRTEGGTDYNDLHFPNRQLFLQMALSRGAQRSGETGGGPRGDGNWGAAWS